MLSLPEVHCKCVSLKFRTLGALISSTIFSALFFLSSLFETLLEYTSDLSVVLHVPEALLFFLLVRFSLFFRLDFGTIDLASSFLTLSSVVLILQLSPSSDFYFEYFIFQSYIFI